MVLCYLYVLDIILRKVFFAVLYAMYTHKYIFFVSSPYFPIGFGLSIFLSNIYLIVQQQLVLTLIPHLSIAIFFHNNKYTHTHTDFKSMRKNNATLNNKK